MCVYGDVLENINLGIVILNVNRQAVIYRNKTALDIFQNCCHLSDYDAITAALIPDLQALIGTAGKTKSRELRLGERVYGYTAYTFSNEYICVFILDITEKVRLESIAEAVDTMNNIGYIFSGVRHEIGNPINSMKTTLTVLAKNLERFSSSTVLEYVERAQAEVCRVEYLLHSLKSFNMFESPRSTHVDLESFMADFLLLITQDLTEKGITIHIEIAPEAKTVFADPRALQQVMLNVVTNSVDALEKRKEPQICIAVTSQGKEVKITIEDNGSGMGDDQLNNLFKPFCTTKIHGNGLGLVICRKMLSKMNSTISVMSTRNAGTTVELSLPNQKGERPTYGRVGG